MTLDLLDPDRIEAAATHYLSHYKGDLAARELLKDTIENFHDSETWEQICLKAEDSIVERLKPLLKNGLSHNDVMVLHNTMMTAIAVGCIAGFDAGYQLQIDTTIERLGNLN